MRKAMFQIVKDKPGHPLVIRDVGPWDTFPTVTNAAEGVVSDLFAMKKLEDGRRLWCYDSDGELSELLIQNKEFSGFKDIMFSEDGEMLFDL